MGRHSESYIAARRGRSAPATSAPARVARAGLLAAALGIGAAIAGGTAIAGADSPSTTSDERGVQSAPATSSDAPDDTGLAHKKSRNVDTGTDNTPGDDASDDRSDVPAPDAVADKDSADRNTVDEDSADPGAVESAPADSEALDEDTQTYLLDSGPPTASPLANSPITVTVAHVPAPTDQTATAYGDVGKWMLQRNGDIADYGGLPYEGRTLLEPVNVIIVDQRSKNSLAATWRLNAAMRRAGFPPQLIHSTGFQGLIDDQRYRQQPRGFLVGYSDDFFLLPNNHGRIFGPDPVETGAGYVWSGAFSTQKVGFVDGLPRHVYTSSNRARDALAAELAASGRARLGGLVALDNSYDTETFSTGDHDGYAAVIILTDRVTTASALPSQSSDTGARGCVVAGSTASSLNAPCAMIAVTTGPR